MNAGARSSPLSRAQVAEVEREFGIQFEMVWVETRGDLDQKTSLREMGRSDFFTRELDAMVLGGEVLVAIHSAKDLPEPMPQGLCVAALTQGVDARDALVLHGGEVFAGMVVATSSQRREEAVRRVCSEAQFVDVRGSVGQRLARLGEVDGVVVAEAALIRLGLTHLNRIYLPGETAPLQGKLAIVAREDDVWIKKFFTSGSIR